MSGDATGLRQAANSKEAGVCVEQSVVERNQDESRFSHGPFVFGSLSGDRPIKYEIPQPPPLPPVAEPSLANSQRIDPGWRLFVRICAHLQRWKMVSGSNILVLCCFMGSIFEFAYYCQDRTRAKASRGNLRGRILKLRLHLITNMMTLWKEQLPLDVDAIFGLTE